MQSWSLKKRMTVVSSVILVVAFSLIYFIAKSAYTAASKSRLQESLVAQIYALMAVADEQDGQITLPEIMRNDRLNHVNSGLVAYVLEADGDLVWRSRSSDLFSILPDISQDYSLTELTVWRIESYRMFWIGDTIIWEHEDGTESEYLFLIGEKRTLLTAAVREFKREIMYWLFLTAFILIVVLGFALNISLLPLRNAQRQIELISRGDAERVEGEFPAELAPLTSSINRFIESEINQKKRYRDTLGNLAHSLKTPLAVVKSEIHQLGESAKQVELQKQIERIDDIVKYQLNRSVVTAGQTMKRKSLVEPEVKKIVDALNKVHMSKGLEITYEVAEDCYFPGEQGDLMELVGNLADNACKWANKKINIQVKHSNQNLIIAVEDDGTGIPEEKRALILDRGKRLDQQAEGQGLGLSIVMDIIKTYQGQIRILESQLGGAEFELTIPV
ncbi:ATP-binding protein [Aliikangiella marina]|nr:ATP-binding protein [Aliikangiella marina]